jgi:hypothetical protein
MPSFRAALFGLLSGLFIHIPCSAWAETSAGANSLFVQAVKGWQSADDISGEDIASAKLRLEVLDEVDTALETIVEEHSGSDLAVSLVIGETVGPLSIEIVRLARRGAELDFRLAQCSSAPSAECLLNTALDNVIDMKRENQDSWLRSIASAQAHAGLFGQSQETAQSIASTAEQQKALTAISISLAEAGLVDQALSLATTVADEGLSSDAYKAIVTSEIELENLEKAKNFLGKVTDQDQHRDALIDLATALAEKGAVAEALALLTELDDYWRSVGMRDVVAVQVLDGKYEAALDTVRNIPEPMYTCEAAANIAIAMDDHEMIEKIVAFAQSLSFAYDKELCLRTIGIQTARADILAEARGLAIERGGFGLWYGMVDELHAGLFDEGVKSASAAATEENRSESFQLVALKAIEAGKTEYAYRSLPYLKPHHETDIRGMLWSIDGRKEHVDRLMTLSSKIRDDYLSEDSALSGFVRRVDNVTLLHQATVIASNIPNDDVRNGALTAIAETYAKSGLYTEAIQIIRRMEPRFELLSALVGVGSLMK